MRFVLIIFAILYGCKADEALPATTPGLDPMKVAFVSHCKFRNGAHILLVHKFDSATYHFIVANRGHNDISTIKRGQNEQLEIETNGGLGKILGVEKLRAWLIKQPFRAVSEPKFSSELVRNDVPFCPGKYPFSP